MNRTRVLQLAGAGAGVLALVATLVVVSDDGFDVRRVFAAPVDGGSESDSGGTPEDGDGPERDREPTDGDRGTGRPGASESDGPEVVVDWAMAARAGLDRDGDGVTDHACNERGVQFTDFSGGCYEPDPDTFAVTLDACATTGIEGATFTWSVAGQSIDAVSCDVAVELPEGTHDVVVSAAVDGAVVAGPTTVPVPVDDILIVAIGDSWTVGIGAPDRPGDGAAGRSWEAAIADVLAADERLQEAEAVLAEARGRLDRAERDLRTARADAEDALDECFTRRFGVTVVKVSGLRTCLSALAGLGVDIVRDVSDLRGLIDDAVDDAEDVLDGARTLLESAVAGAEDARRALTNAAAALSAVGDVDDGTYMHEECSRSANAGPAQAARRIEEADPRTSVTLLHLSCAGARVTDLIGKTDQIGEAALVSGEREVDLVLLGVGGNDVELNTLLGRLCPRQLECHRDEVTATADAGIRRWCGDWAIGSLGEAARIAAAGTTAITDACVTLYEGAVSVANDASEGREPPAGLSAAAWFEELVAGTLPRDACRSTSDPTDLKSAGLALRYDCVAAELEKRFDDRLAAEDIVVWEYIDVVHGSDGELCPRRLTSGNPTDPTLRGPPGFTTPELAFADEVFATLNGEIRAAAARHGWTFVETHGASRRHGMCADDNWIARPDQAIFGVAGASSLAHPTIDGMTYLGDRIADGVGPLLP